MKPIIRHNLARFKDALLFEPHPSRGKKRSYPAYLNCHTGDLQFEKIPTQPKEWKEVRLVIREEPGKVTFDLRDPNGNPIRHQGLALVAWKVACELLSLLNSKGGLLHKLPTDELPEAKIVEDLAQQEESSSDSIEQNPSWAGQMTRIHAEFLLSNKAPGTYLLRSEEGGMTQEIARRLSSENDLFVQVYLLTYVASEDKVVDSCILATERGWTLYRDNPDLSDSEYIFYPNLNALLASCFAR